MKGDLTERSPSRWAIVLDVRDPETGAGKRKWHSFRGTKRAAENECARLIASMNCAPTYNHQSSRWQGSSTHGSTTCNRR
jgi:hypothetical protein